MSCWGAQQATYISDAWSHGWLNTKMHTIEVFTMIIFFILEHFLNVLKSMRMYVAMKNKFKLKKS
jgi:hypothetical protein